MDLHVLVNALTMCNIQQLDHQSLSAGVQGKFTLFHPYIVSLDGYQILQNHCFYKPAPASFILGASKFNETRAPLTHNTLHGTTVLTFDVCHQGMV